MDETYFIYSDNLLMFHKVENIKVLNYISYKFKGKHITNNFSFCIKKTLDACKLNELDIAK